MNINIVKMFFLLIICLFFSCLPWIENDTSAKSQQEIQKKIDELKETINNSPFGKSQWDFFDLVRSKNSNEIDSLIQEYHRYADSLKKYGVDEDYKSLKHKYNHLLKKKKINKEHKEYLQALAKTKALEKAKKKKLKETVNKSVFGKTEAEFKNYIKTKKINEIEALIQEYHNYIDSLKRYKVWDISELLEDLKGKKKLLLKKLKNLQDPTQVLSEEDTQKMKQNSEFIIDNKTLKLHYDPGHIIPSSDEIFGTYGEHDVIVKKVDEDKLENSLKLSKALLGPTIFAKFKDFESNIWIIMEQYVNVDPHSFQPLKNDNSSEKLIIECFKNLRMLRKEKGFHGSLSPFDILMSKDKKHIKFIGFIWDKFNETFSNEGNDVLKFARILRDWRFEKILKPVSFFYIMLFILKRFIDSKTVKYKKNGVDIERRFDSGFNHRVYRDRIYLNTEDKKLGFFKWDLFSRYQEFERYYPNRKFQIEKYLFENLLIDDTPNDPKKITQLLKNNKQLWKKIKNGWFDIEHGDPEESKKLMDLCGTEINEFLNVYYYPLFDKLKEKYNLDLENDPGKDFDNKLEKAQKEYLKKDFWSKGLPNIINNYCDYEVTKFDRILFKAADKINVYNLSKIISDLEKSIAENG